MGYTHYWQQKKSFSKRAWREICADVAEILKNVVEVQGVPLDASITADYLDINGTGAEFCENLLVHRERPETQPWQKPASRGSDFTKTARERYDVAVTAVLIYLSTLYPKHIVDVTTDGSGWNWLAGLDVCRQALPKYDNQFDIPLGIRQDDRWTSDSYFSINESDYHPRACVNGKVYVFHRGIAMHAFTSVDEWQAWALSEKESLACGYTHSGNRASVKARQNAAFKRLLLKPSAALDDIPAFVRPNCMVKFDPSLLNHAPADSFEEAV